MVVQARVRVRCNVEISLKQPWSSGATIDEINKRASEEAIGTMLCLLEGSTAKVIGCPVVEVVIVSEK